MLGWHISVYRKNFDRFVVPKKDELGDVMSLPYHWKGERLAVWTTGWQGLDWLDELTEQGHIVNIGGRAGMPWLMAVKAKHVIGRLGKDAPGARDIWTHDPGDILLPGYEGKSSTDKELESELDPEEWLAIVAWDQS